MPNKCALSFWSVDAFLYFVAPYRQVSPYSSELISRISLFIDAYVLFDKVVLPERYSKDSTIKKLDPSEKIFEFIPSASLIHSDDIAKGITVDLSFNYVDFETLERENYKWFSQHTGYIDQAQYELALAPRLEVGMAHLRLWQTGLLNEIMDLTGSSSLLPLYLQNVEADANRAQLPRHVEQLNRLSEHFNSTIESVSAYASPAFDEYIKNAPPLFSLLVDQALSREHAVDCLVALRRDYYEIRQTGQEFQNTISAAKTLREKKAVIDEWDDSWQKLTAGSFKKDQLLKKKVSSAEVAKVLANPIAIASTILQNFLDHLDGAKIHKRFRIFSELYSELDGISGTRKSLREKFLADLVNEL